MRILRLCIATAARFFMSAVFLAGAVKNIFHWHETEKEIMNVFSDWQSHVDFSRDAQVFFSLLIPWTSLLQIFATSLMLVGGLLLLLGIKEKLGAALLVLFLIPVTVLYHPFWWEGGVSQEIQTVMFLKNLAILGCLIQLLLQGSPAMSEGREKLSSLRF